MAATTGVTRPAMHSPTAIRLYRTARIKLSLTPLRRRRAAVRERPHIPGHLAALAGFFARKSPFRDLNRALAMIQTASGMAMNTPAEKAGILMIEGNIRMERGEFPAAAETYESAFKASPGPESADTLFLAGTAWNAAGQPVKARAFFEEVLHWKPDHRGALSALGKFGG